ncbi:MAG: hypothetical protein IT450_03065 [Phycisphaerales bacterium]|nr:hypothetical protein [Phycisphaerales bacterium]
MSDKRPWDLEDWLTEADGVIEKHHYRGPESLTVREWLLFEFWEFDTQQRNGGVSQYFCNNPIERWNRLCAIVGPVSPAFASFAALVDSAIEGAADPYEAIIESSVDLDVIYWNEWAEIVGQVKAAYCDSGRDSSG